MANYLAKNGCIYREREGGLPPLLIARFAPNGFNQQAFADPDAKRLSEIAADALNAAKVSA